MTIRRLSTTGWVLTLSVGVLIPLVVALTFIRPLGPVSWRDMLSVAAAYLVAQLLLSVPLQVDANVHTIFMPTEMPLLLGAVLLGPIPHIVVCLIAGVTSTLVRRRSSAHNRRIHIGLVSGAWNAAELGLFRVVLVALHWNGLIRGWSWGSVCVALMVGSAGARLIVGWARILSGERIDWRDVFNQSFVNLSFSVITLGAAGILIAGWERDRFTLVFLAMVVIVMIVPLRRFSTMWVRWRETSDLYEFAELLTRSTSRELEPVLVQAAAATKTTTAELILLERAGVDDTTDAVLHATASGHVARRFEELPESWKTVLKSGTAYVRLDRAGMSPEQQPLTNNEIVSALFVGQIPIGLLVCSEQLDPKKSIEARDVEVSAVLARHLGMWLEQDRLVAELRHEITERTQQALQDPVTGLPNRRKFNEALHEQIAAGQPCAIFVLDLDGFKGVNDLIGHEAGDVVLCHVGERLTQAMPRRALVARLGGDEFAVLLPGIRGGLDVDHLGRDLRDELARPHMFEEKSFEVGGSIGISLFPDHGRDLGELLRNADAAMYAAKNSESGSGVVVYGDRRSFVSSSAHRLVDAVRLKSAIEDRHIVAWYQPIVSTDTCRVVGFEALARWEDNGRIITPDKFITLAEDTRVVTQVTELIVSHAFNEATRWKAQTGKDIGVSVNLSPVGLADPHLITHLVACFESTGLDPGLVTLEITESRLMRDPERSIALLQRMRDLGVKLALDDFGTGHSSLQWLNKLPVNTLKIDRSFIMDLGLDSRRQGITEVTVLLGNKLGMDITAEGVETSAQWNAIRELGVDKAQGYLFAKPMPRHKVDEWLALDEPHLAHTLALVGSLPSASSVDLG